MEFKTTDLCNACEDAQACELPFMGFGRKRAFAGTIRTARYSQGINALRDLIHQQGHDQVLVIDGAEAGWRVLFGDVMAGVAARNGWAGVIVNGAIRDRVEIDQMNIGVKALGTVPRRANIGGRGGTLMYPFSSAGSPSLPGRVLSRTRTESLFCLPARRSRASRWRMPSRQRLRTLPAQGATLHGTRDVGGIQSPPPRTLRKQRRET